MIGKDLEGNDCGMIVTVEDSLKTTAI